MKRWLLPVVAAIALVVSGVLFWKARRPVAAVPREAPGTGTVPAPSGDLQAQLEAALAELDRLRAARPSERLPQTAGKAPATATPETRLQDLAGQLEEGRKELTAANEQLAGFREKLQQAEHRMAQWEEQQRKMQESEKAAREELQAANNRIEELEVQRKSQSVRLAQLEVTNNDLRKRQEEHSRKVTQLRQLWESMEDVMHRRESYLTSILTRYREATDTFRAMAVRMDTMRDSTPTASTDLSRIQNAITMADEDLRQLRALTARATQLQKDLRAAGR